MKVIDGNINSHQLEIMTIRCEVGCLMSLASTELLNGYNSCQDNVFMSSQSVYLGVTYDKEMDHDCSGFDNKKVIQKYNQSEFDDINQ